MRMPFSELFSINPDGRLTPRVRVKLGPVTMGPGGAQIPPSTVSFGGVKLIEIQGCDLEVEVIDGVYIITGAYK